MNTRKIILEIYREQRAIDFAWNAKDDCLGVAAAVAQAMTGRDPIAHLRGRYDSEQSAKRVMVEEGWSSMGDVAASIFPNEIPVAQARAGDWLFVVNPDGTETIGVAVNEWFMAKGKAGVDRGLLSHASRAFRVE
jgi:hypothetical protein